MTRDLKYKVSNLQPLTTYSLSVVAINTYGSSLMAVPSEVTTAAGKGQYGFKGHSKVVHFTIVVNKYNSHHIILSSEVTTTDV